MFSVMPQLSDTFSNVIESPVRGFFLRYPLQNCRIPSARNAAMIQDGTGAIYQLGMITRWLQDNNTSPLTNEELPHRNVFLISSLTGVVGSFLRVCRERRSQMLKTIVNQHAQAAGRDFAHEPYQVVLLIKPVGMAEHFVAPGQVGRTDALPQERHTIKFLVWLDSCQVEHGRAKVDEAHETVRALTPLVID